MAGLRLIATTGGGSMSLLASKIKILYYIGACLRLLTQRVVGLCRKKTCFYKEKEISRRSDKFAREVPWRSQGEPREALC